MWLTIRSGDQRGRVVHVTGERFVIGRTDGCDLVLRDDKVSRQHCALKPTADGRAFLEDLQSTNGTWVDGNRVVAPLLLQGNEQIQVGDVGMVTSSRQPAESATQAHTIVQAPAPGPPRGFTGERRALRRGVRAALVLGAVAMVVAVVLGALLVSDLLQREEPASPVPQAVAEVVEQVTPSTALVITRVDGQRIASGTGWVLDAEEGLVVTNFHVVNGGTAWSVGVGDQLREARVVGGAPCEDLAVLQVVDASGLRTLPLGSQADLHQGDGVVALGYPISGTVQDVLIVTEGIVSAVKTTFDIPSIDVPQFRNVVQTDAAINPGNSGGPLVDLQGRLVGVNTAIQRRAGGQIIEGQGFAIGVDRVKEIVPILRQGRSVAWTGMSLLIPGIDVDPASVGLPAGPGLIVDTVVPGTTAEEAGFGRTPTLITAVDGRPLGQGIPGYCQAVGQGTSGDVATFSVITPGGGRQAVQVRFE